MFKEGFTEDTDVDQMRINKSNLDNMIQNLTGQREVAIKLLKFQLGMEFSQELILSDNLEDIIITGNFQYLFPGEFNVSSSIDYKIMDNQVDLQNAAYRRMKTFFLPTVAGF
jgi:hypothetical protein